MDKETRERLDALEVRITLLEERPVATLEVTEVDSGKMPSKRGTNPRHLTDEQKATKVAQLRAGKARAEARRAAERVDADAEETEAKRAQAKTDAIADMAEDDQLNITEPIVEPPKVTKNTSTTKTAKGKVKV